MEQIADLSKRVIVNPVFNIYDKKLSLTDTVILYNDGFFWKAIPHEIMLKYPVIQDKYEDKIISVYSCPNTLFSCVYFGEFVPGNPLDNPLDNSLNNHNYRNNLTLVSENNLIVPIMNKIYDRETMNLTDLYIRKGEVKIMTLRNAISIYPDIRFINTSCINMKEPNIISNNKGQKNQIIYLIEYYSKKIYQDYNHNNYKYTAIIPKNNVFDIKKNNFDKYFNKMIEKIRDKGGHIYPCYLNAWENTGISYKKIYI
jgi:hypothetical protein